MKRKYMCIGITIVAVLVASMMAGCVENSEQSNSEFLTEYVENLPQPTEKPRVSPAPTPTLEPTPTPTPIPTPKFKVGDIIHRKGTNSNSIFGSHILDSRNEGYVLIEVVNGKNGSWINASGFNYAKCPGWAQIDNGYMKIGEIDKKREKDTPVQTIKTTTVTQKPQRIQLNVIYSGSWSGSYGDIEGLKSVDGTGSETFTISSPKFIVSASIQKKDDTDRTLTVEILKNGAVVKSESTSAAYGVVLLSYTL